MASRTIALLFIILALAGCATTEDNADVVEDPSAQVEAPPAQDAPVAETSEQDLQNPPAEQAAEAPPADQQVAQGQEQVPPPEAVPEAAVAEQAPPVPEPQAEAPAPEAPAAQEAPARITGIDYQANVNGGTFVVKTNREVQVTSRKNEANNQFIIEFQNTVVPSRFRRPYNTKEFGGAIASVNAYQAKGADNTARIVVQMRDTSEPGVTQEGNKVLIAGAGGSPGAVAQNAEPPPPDTEMSTEEAPPAEEPMAEVATDGTAGNKTLADFITGNNKFYGRPISFEVKDSDIRDVLRFISEESGLNILVGEDVQGKISLKLRKIPWDQALAVILQSKQLGYIRQGNILRIAKLSSLQAESDAARSVLESQRLLQPLRVQLFPISYAKVEDLEGQAKEFLSVRGKARGDKRTNTLVVTDIEENLTKISELIRRLDTQTPQVLIEAKVVEARESFSKVVGINWNMSGQAKNIGNNLRMTPRFNSGSNSGSTFAELGVSVGTLDVLGDLNATLRLLELERMVKVISSPRIVTLDRAEAKIEQTTSFPVFSSSTSTTSNTTSTSVTFQDVRLELKVKPQITIEGGIIMEVSLLREFPDAATELNGSSARAINKRSAQTQVLVDNGDTIVLGGIYQSDVSEGETGIPWLRKIPLLGALFRQRSTEREKNELVMFLTPRVLNREKAFGKSTETPDVSGGEG
ncbi:MAG: type IV pilus secretin PilQ [Oligoflexia bacterium]|nr:type IV pilus secretin PilQ [Oligoflexia bacterium]